MMEVIPEAHPGPITIMMAIWISLLRIMEKIIFSIRTVEIVTAGLIILGSHYLANRIGWLVFSTLIGGIVMIFGYFIYGAYVLNLGINAALVEVPINMGQVLIGTIVAIPLSRSILENYFL